MKQYISPLVELLRGLISHIPGGNAPFFTQTGGTDSARYCFSVWMRHLVLARENGASHEIPKIVAELGPGDSLGIGLCALLSGVEMYFAFDVVKYANPEKNLEIFEELVELFRKRAAIPDDREFPKVKPKLASYDFPANILTEDLLENSQDEKRLGRTRESIKNPVGADSMIIYQVPWNDSSIIKKNSVDMIFSQATLEHVDEIERTYQTMHEWLKPGGFMTHQIDLKCHGTAREWNGHWTYSDFWWKMIRGRRPWLLNRHPCSAHLDLAEKKNFEIVLARKTKASSKIKRESLDDKFKNISDEDLETSGVFFIARKK